MPGSPLHDESLEEIIADDVAALNTSAGDSVGDDYDLSEFDSLDGPGPPGAVKRP